MTKAKLQNIGIIAGAVAVGFLLIRALSKPKAGYMQAEIVQGSTGYYTATNQSDNVAADLGLIYL